MCVTIFYISSTILSTVLYYTIISTILCSFDIILHLYLSQNYVISDEVSEINLSDLT